MNHKGYELETVYQVWNNDTGERIELGPDMDGLDLVEIREYDYKNEIKVRVTFTKDQGRLLKEALDKMLSKED